MSSPLCPLYSFELKGQNKRARSFHGRLWSATIADLLLITKSLQGSISPSSWLWEGIAPPLPMRHFPTKVYQCSNSSQEADKDRHPSAMDPDDIRVIHSRCPPLLASTPVPGILSLSTL